MQSNLAQMVGQEANEKKQCSDISNQIDKLKQQGQQLQIELKKAEQSNSITEIQNKEEELTK